MKFNRKIVIDDHEVSDGSTAFFIAEAGVNHNGDMKVAKQLVDIAVRSGANAVKFQSFKTESLILKDVDKPTYQKASTGSTESQFEMLKKLEISIDQTREIKSYCEEKGITFLTTPFDEDSLHDLDQLNLAAYKVASTDLTNIGFLRQIAKKRKPIILSTGMSYIDEVDKALRAIFPYNQDVILLQCTANYPIKDTDANLNVLHTYAGRYDMLTGYSDHTVGLGASPYAVAMGAKVVEKHFTISKDMSGPDHTASLSPEELIAFQKEIRKVEALLGSFEKRPTADEQENRKKLQKYLVASRHIAAGEVFSSDNIVAKRTGGQGLAAICYDDVMGQIARKDFQPDELIAVP